MAAFGSEMGERFGDLDASEASALGADNHATPKKLTAERSTLNRLSVDKWNAESSLKTARYLVGTETCRTRTPSDGAFPRSRLRLGGRPTPTNSPQS